MLLILGSCEKGEIVLLMNCVCEVNSIENFLVEDLGRMVIIEGFFVLDFKKFFIEIVDIVFVVLYVIVVFIGLIGNCLVIIVVYRIRFMYLIINFFFVNLVVSDVIILLWCLRIYSFVFYLNYLIGKFGDYICKIFIGNVIISVVIVSFVLMLMIFVIERYYVFMKLM